MHVHRHWSLSLSLLMGGGRSQPRDDAPAMYVPRELAGLAVYARELDMPIGGGQCLALSGPLAGWKDSGRKNLSRSRQPRPFVLGRRRQVQVRESSRASLLLASGSQLDVG